MESKGKRVTKETGDNQVIMVLRDCTELKERREKKETQELRVVQATEVKRVQRER